MTEVNKVARLSSSSGFAEIIEAYGFATCLQLQFAREIRQSELDSISRADMRAGRRARLLGEILMDLVCVRMEQVEFCLKVQRNLQQTSAAE